MSIKVIAYILSEYDDSLQDYKPINPSNRDNTPFWWYSHTSICQAFSRLEGRYPGILFRVLVVKTIS